MENERMMTRIRLYHVTDTLASHHGQSSGSSLYLYITRAHRCILSRNLSPQWRKDCVTSCANVGDYIQILRTCRYTLLTALD